MDVISNGDFVSDLQTTTITPSVVDSNYTFLSILKMVIILSILLFLGINVFGYTEIVIEKMFSIVEYVLKYFGYSIISITDATIEQSRKGVVAIKDASNRLLSDVNDLDGVSMSSSKPISGTQIKYRNNEERPGFCYVGREKGVRTCVKLNEYTKCMSGDVFPRIDICINPKLRT